MSQNPSFREHTNTDTPPYSLGMDRLAINSATSGLNSSELVQFWSTFQSTEDVPNPAAATGRIVDDIAAVLAGSKPATLLDANEVYNPSVETFINDEEDHFDQLFFGQAVDYYGGRKYFVGKEENVRTLSELYEGRGGIDSPRPADENFHRAVGEALGYPTEAIDAFILRIVSSEQAQKSGVLSKYLGTLDMRR